MGKLREKLTRVAHLLGCLGPKGEESGQKKENLEMKPNLL
jgi:hypothetical protein